MRRASRFALLLVKVRLELVGLLLNLNLGNVALGNVAQGFNDGNQLAGLVEYRPGIDGQVKILPAPWHPAPVFGMYPRAGSRVTRCGIQLAHLFESRGGDKICQGRGSS
jgi:hypothetical protein